MPRKIGTPGVYQVINIKNGKRYIGSSTVCIYGRLRDHKDALQKNIHKNNHLQYAWNKYGEDAFRFEKVAETEKENARELEDLLFDELRNEDILYNISLRATGGQGGATKGRKQTPEHIEKKAAKNRGKPKSEEHRRSISETLTGKKQEKVSCPHCGKEGGVTNMKRYHFDNCKQKRDE